VLHAKWILTSKEFARCWLYTRWSF